MYPTCIQAPLRVADVSNNTIAHVYWSMAFEKYTCVLWSFLIT